MAKVLIIARQAGPTLEGLLDALVQSHHEVVVLTSGKTQAVMPVGSFEVWGYFKRWSVWEVAGLLPRVLQLNPEILHFVFTDGGGATPSPAEIALAAFFSRVTGRAVAASYFGSVVDRGNWYWKLFLEHCQLVTFGTRESLMYMKRKGLLSDEVVNEVVPPLALEMARDGAQPKEDLQRLVISLQPYFLIPNDEFGAQNQFSYLPEQYNFLFLGPRPAESSSNQYSSAYLNRCYFVSQQLNSADWHLVVGRALGILTAFDDFSLIELQNIYQWSVICRRPVIASSLQLEAFPILCQDRKTGFVLEKGHDDLLQLCLTNPWLTLPPQYQEREAKSIQIRDQIINNLNRLYIQVMSSV